MSQKGATCHASGKSTKANCDKKYKTFEKNRFQLRSLWTNKKATQPCHFDKCVQQPNPTSPNEHQMPFVRMLMVFTHLLETTSSLRCSGMDDINIEEARLSSLLQRFWFNSSDSFGTWVNRAKGAIFICSSYQDLAVCTISSHHSPLDDVRSAM